MTDCSFEFNIDMNAAEVVEKVKGGIENEGGKFNGNENEGTFSLPTPIGTIEGNYSVINNELKIDITKKPMMLPCSIIESELKKRIE